MKFKSFFRIKFKYPSLMVFLFTTLLFSSPSVSAQTPQLSLVDIFTALRSNKATLSEKNEILAEGVKQRGITFTINKTLENELRNAGANDDLIQVIQQKSPVPDPIPPAKVESSLKPVATPPPPDFSFYRNRGNSKFVLGEYESAIKDYDEAINLNAGEAEIFISRGLAFYNNRQFNQAIADFGKAIELDPNESMTYYNRGNALQEIGKFEKALTDYKNATELDSENELAMTAYENLEAKLKTNSAPPKLQMAANSNATKEIVQTVKATEKPSEKSAPNTPVAVESFQELAINLATPGYPSFERSNNISGIVTVKVTIDIEGKVISAEAVNGPKGLRRPSENAARRSKFKPYLVETKPVSATGFITYNFQL